MHGMAGHSDGCAEGQGRNETSQSDLLSPIRHLLVIAATPNLASTLSR